MNKDNPNEKPSFFGSGEESKSWPPADNYELENKSSEDSMESFFEKDNFETSFKRNFEKAEEANFSDDFLVEEDENDDDEVQVQETELLDLDQIKEENYIDSDDFLDQLIDNVDEKTNIGSMRIIDDEEDFEDKVDTNKSFINDETLSFEDISKNQEVSNASYDEDLEHNISIENIINDSELQEAIAEEDFDFDDLIETTSNSTEFETEDESQDDFDEDLLGGDLGIGTTGVAFSDPEGFTQDNDLNDLRTELEAEFGSQVEDYKETSFETLSKSSEYAESDFIDFIDDDNEYQDDTTIKPFRAFTKINLAEELAEEKDEELKAVGILAGTNRNVLIIFVIILLSLGYFLFNTFFNKQIETKTRQKTRPPKKEKSVVTLDQSQIPVWEISEQNIVNLSAEEKYAESLIKFTGRENPFAMPQSVIDALKKQADLELLSKKKPNSYKRLAYRATLLGVLTSEGNTIALVNTQEAGFDIVEGTSKKKILTLATKAMDKAKKDTLEMSKGSFIGPWEIIEVTAPKGLSADARIIIQFQDTQKVLNMGKAEDLGIFDPGGQIDDLENSGGDDSDDDSSSDDDF
jgi:hypothetical protein